MPNFEQLETEWGFSYSTDWISLHGGTNFSVLVIFMYVSVFFFFLNNIACHRHFLYVFFQMHLKVSYVLVKFEFKISNCVVFDRKALIWEP